MKLIKIASKKELKERGWYLKDNYYVCSKKGTFYVPDMQRLFGKIVIGSIVDIKGSSDNRKYGDVRLILPGSGLGYRWYKEDLTVLDSNLIEVLYEK